MFVQIFFVEAKIVLSFSQWLCNVAAAFLHYFLLALFSWMFVEGLYMYKSLIQVFSSRAHTTFKKYFILGYGKLTVYPTNCVCPLNVA